MEFGNNNNHSNSSHLKRGPPVSHYVPQGWAYLHTDKYLFKPLAKFTNQIVHVSQKKSARDGAEQLREKDYFWERDMEVWLDPLHICRMKKQLLLFKGLEFYRSKSRSLKCDMINTQVHC